MRRPPMRLPPLRRPPPSTHRATTRPMSATSAAPDVGTTAPAFAVDDAAGHVHRLADFRGHPVVLVFLPTRWDPARAELIDRYNRLVADVGGAAGARLLGVTGDGPWRELTFADDALRLPVLAEDGGALAQAFGVADTSAVFVLDGDGVVRWRHVAASDPLPRPDDLARALAGALVDAPHASRDRGGWTRREFVAAALGASAALALGARTASASAARPNATATSSPDAPPGAVPVALTVNGRTLSMELDPRVTLLDALREHAGLTGSKKGCDHGQCGACTVHADGRRVLSCLTLAVMAQGHAITTIEGLAPDADTLHPLQQAFVAHDGFQCGYCTPGQIMSAAAVLREPWGPGDDDVREAMSGNICRCGAYPGILAAVQDVRRQRAAAGGD